MQKKLISFCALSLKKFMFVRSCREIPNYDEVHKVQNLLSRNSE